MQGATGHDCGGDRERHAGPVLAGAVSDQAAVHAGMAFSAALLALGSLVALTQPDPDPPRRPGLRIVAPTSTGVSRHRSSIP